MFEDPYLPRSEETRALYELSGLFVDRGAPDFSRSDNGSEFTAQPIGRWLQRLGVKTLFIEPGSPWENGYIESFNGKMRDELLNGEIFDTILETKVITERWRGHYNTVRPHSSLQIGSRTGVWSGILCLTEEIFNHAPTFR